jgi:hypothetical protein
MKMHTFIALALLKSAVHKFTSTEESKNGCRRSYARW